MATYRKRGRFWQAQVRVKGFPAQNATFDTKTEAKRWAQEVEASIRAGRYKVGTEADRITLAELADRYATEITPTHRSCHSERLRLERLKKTDLASHSLARITSVEIARYRDERLKRVKPGTVIRELGLISHIFTCARREWGYLLENPVRDVRRPRQPQGRDRRLEAGEEEQLLAAAAKARSPWIQPLIIIAIETAARRGELLTLQWHDVDFSARVATLRQTKNGEARSLPLSSRALQTLHQLPRSVDGRVFPTTANSVTLAWKRTRNRANLPDFRFHDLRHEATSRFFERGFSITEVASITGHKDLRMLYRYTHHRAAELAQRLG